MIGYFLKLGTIGFGGPVALAGYMNRDLVEQRGWVSEDEYKLGLTLAQVMPGPLAAQLAIALGYFQYGVLGGLSARIPADDYPGSLDETAPGQPTAQGLRSGGHCLGNGRSYGRSGDSWSEGNL